MEKEEKKTIRKEGHIDFAILFIVSICVSRCYGMNNWGI